MILDGDVFDYKGLIYGLGHAVYSLSDHREVISKDYIKQRASSKGKDKAMNLCNIIE